MKMIHIWLIGTLAATPLICPFAHSMEVVVLDSNEQHLFLDIHPDITLADLNEHLDTLVNANEGPWTLVAARNNVCSPKTSYEASTRDSGYSWDINEGARDYYYNPNAEDKANIAYVVKTLANKSEISLLLYGSSVAAAGNKTSHVHPLKFLYTIFSDEELKVGMRNIRKKSMVWKKFRDGICDSLGDEQSLDNMKVEYLSDFCNGIGVDYNQIVGMYQQAQWRDFVEWLVTNVPRRGDHRRYDM